MLIDDTKAVILVLSGVSAAFDTVDGNLLESRVMARLSIDRSVLTWLKSYIFGRTQKVNIDDVF